MKCTLNREIGWLLGSIITTGIVAFLGWVTLKLAGADLGWWFCFFAVWTLRWLADCIYTTIDEGDSSVR